MLEAEREGFHRKFKLEGAVATSNMVGALCVAYDVRYTCVYQGMSVSLSILCIMCVYSLRGPPPSCAALLHVAFHPCCYFVPQVLFDPNGCLRRYSDSGEILKEFFELRLERYRTRKEYLEGKLQAEADKITSQARFVMEMYSGTIIFRE